MVEERARTRHVYRLMLTLPRHRHPVEWTELPYDGVYVFFQDGETADLNGQTVDRIVRIGTNSQTGHFRECIRKDYAGNKNTSVFRKYLGAAIMCRNNPGDPRLTNWLAGRGGVIPEIELAVSETLRSDFSFSYFRVCFPSTRQALERGLVAQLAKHPLGKPSGGWLGNFAVRRQIQNSGLWNVQHVCGDPLTAEEFGRLETLAGRREEQPVF